MPRAILDPALMEGLAMPSVFGINTPKEAWAHVHHRIGNDFSVIQGWTDLPDEIDEDHRFNNIVSARISLIGTLCVLALQMEDGYYTEVAAKIKALLDMVVRQDVTDPAVFSYFWSTLEEHYF